MKNRHWRWFTGVLVSVLLLVTLDVQAINLRSLENTPASAFT